MICGFDWILRCVCAGNGLMESWGHRDQRGGARTSSEHVSHGGDCGDGLHGGFCWESQRDAEARDARSPSSLPSPERDRSALPRTARLGAAARA